MADSTGAPGPAQVGAAVAVIDGEGIILGWTYGAERLLGHRAEDVVGRSGTALLTQADTTPGLSAWVARARIREPWSQTLDIRHKDGRTVPALIQAAPLSGAGRTDWFVTATDLPGASPWPPARSSLTAALLARSPVGLSVWGMDLRCIWLNSAAEQQDGILRRDRLGRRMTEVQPGYEGRTIEAAMRGVIETGVPVIEREYRWTAPGDTDERVLSSSYFRLDGADGKPIGVCNVATDISKSLARQHLLMLGQAGARIGTTLDVRRTAQELTEVAVPLLADYVTVDLAEWVPLGEEPGPRPVPRDTDSLVLRRAGMTSVHAGLPSSLWDLGETVFIPPSSPFTETLSTGRSHFEPVLDSGPGSWLARDPARARAVRVAGMHSLIIAPVQARGTVLGVTSFIRTTNRTPFSRDDLLLVEELVGRAALSLDNARRYTRERAASLALQRNLLPQYLSGGGAVEVASRYLPADTHEGVGGDWFDVIPLPGKRVGLVVGDVVGHGINAAARMGQFRTVVRTLADLDLPPDALLSRLDRLVVRLAEQNGGDEGLAAPSMGGTCAYVVYDATTRICTMACAGHPPPAVLYPDGTVTFPDLPVGAPIGIGLTAYDTVTMELPEGSVIALYTDGLIETREADLDDGMRRLGAALRGRSGSSLEEICAATIGTPVGRERWNGRDARRNPGRGAGRDPGSCTGSGSGDGPGSGPAPLGMLTGRSAEDDVALLLARTLVARPSGGA
ncbi:SpoIIE family protein phosphatase [Actinacidiphila sp. ITFR-21]|uniref:SpoIIE family protein phosphatase n=1 Tax=Actinacidiphila sp. ITFR-21 TaxID=3075199 RepID=UPI00288A510D|nr:SpoIIE family protein phosphatase [Streptomyces sp. ITFR-21]WNI17104.1 SpoIIE family protein phosphatase [Streptomyces sp. ITFR-21]